MKLTKVDQLEEGNVLEQDIMTREYQVLLGTGTVLKKEYIEKLKELGINEVFIHDELKIPVKEILILRNDMEKGFHDKIRDVIEKHTYQHNDELQELCQTADAIIMEILTENSVLEKVYDIKQRSADLYEHSISLCTLVTLLALKYSLKKDTVHDMGIACLLHDLGLRYLTLDYKDTNMTEMSEIEFSEYKKHPIYAYTSLKNETWLSNESKNMILMHHEHIDGSGYPLHATSIPLTIQIITICDMFDEMISGIGYKRKKVHEAVEFLRTAANQLFPQQLVDNFLNFIAIYPVGTKVKLSTGEEAIVVKQNHAFPDRPIIRIIRDKNGKTVTKEIERDLVKEASIFVEDAN
ncbi:MAG: HD domain-containing protein [Lachnospiraceae bacterium]|nr:HD domain-containing protein [Lachnospiraceae bacterium]MBD5482009.1 HD domain-containing protein [Lachnospiraceae bacterium]